MADRPFQVIQGGGKPEPDARIIEALELHLVRAKAGEFEGVLIVADAIDGEPEITCAGEDTLRTVSLAEMMLPQVKAYALGLEFE
jgi:hypothetical protein